MDWPAKKFEAFYQAFSNRIAVEDMRDGKARMIQALYSNQSYDSDEGRDAREQAISQMEMGIEEAIDKMYGGFEEIEAPLDEVSPFFEAMERGMPEGAKKEGY
jgi:hypothetical protein